MNEEKLIDKIIKGEKNIKIPVFGNLAFLDVDIIDNKKCFVELSNEYYIQTNINRAKKISERVSNNKIQSEINMKKLDDDTYEIMEKVLPEENEIKTCINKNVPSIINKINEENKKILIDINNKRKNNNTNNNIILQKTNKKSKEEILKTFLKNINK